MITENDKEGMAALQSELETRNATGAKRAGGEIGAKNIGEAERL
jgi:hypothetical protein